MSASQPAYFNPQEFSDAGVLLVGGRLYTYAFGTTTHKTAYTDAAAAVPQTYTSDGLGGQYIALNARGELPATLYLGVGSYDLTLKRLDGSTVWTRRADGVDNLANAGFTSLASVSGAALVGFQQSGVGAIASTLAAKGLQILNSKDYGALPGNTTVQNKTALQKAITAINAAGGGKVINDFDINYGLNFRDLTTYPSFVGMTTDIVVEDKGNGTADGTNKLGAQVRFFCNTNQTVSPGQHDGNFMHMNGAWAPGIGINNIMNLAAVGDPSRLSSDNRRAFFACYNDGICTWQIGQGTRIGAALTDEEMSNFALQKFNNTGDTLTDYTSLIVERKTGNMSYAGGRNIPAAHHHFEAVTSSPTLNTGMFESKVTTCGVTWRNSNGSGDDVEVRNVAGDIALHITGVGNALVALKANRYIGIGTNTPTYPLHVTKAVAGDYVALFENTSATNGYGPKITSGTAAGVGFDLLQMYTSGADIKFRFRGDGAGTCDGAWTGGGADRAEAMEWADGNPGGIDGDKLAVGSTRAGCTVSMVGGKIKIAAPGDVVIGVVSMTYDSLGNANPLNWKKKYLRDDFGVLLYEDYEVVEWTERILVKEAVDAIEPFIARHRYGTKDGREVIIETPDPGRQAEPARYEEIKHSYAADAIPAGVAVPADAQRIPMKRQRLNPDFDPEQAYVSRIERKEWDPIGVLGICRVRKGQVMGANWIKMSDISASVEEWLVR